MSKIVGNVVGIPNPQSDFNQNDPSKADYIKNKPTTVSGYGITDAYTKEEVDARIGSGGGGGGVPAENPEFTGTLSIDGVEIYLEDGDFIIHKPYGESEYAIPSIETTFVLHNGEAEINGQTVYHQGNLDKNGIAQSIGDLEKDVDTLGKNVDDIEKTIGDIDTALDEIIEIQEAHISGNVGDLPLWTGGSY